MEHSYTDWCHDHFIISIIGYSKCTYLVINISERKAPRPYLKLYYRCVYNVFFQLLEKILILTCFLFMNGNEHILLMMSIYYCILSICTIHAYHYHNYSIQQNLERKWPEDTSSLGSFIVEVELHLHREFLRVALYLGRIFPNFLHLRSFKFV